MNQKMIITGKVALATVLATTMGVSTFSNVTAYALEKEDEETEVTDENETSTDLGYETDENTSETETVEPSESEDSTSDNADAVYAEDTMPDMDTVLSHENLERSSRMAPDAAESKVTANINGTSVSGDSLEDAISKSGVSGSDVERLELVSGTITKADFKFIQKKLNYLQDMTINLSNTLQLEDGSTVFPSGFLNKRLVNVTLGGFTEISSRAFEGCTYLETVNMPNVEKIGAQAFYRCSRYKEIHLPSSIREIGSSAFKGAANGIRKLNVTIEATTPPEARGAFNEGTITVPAGSLPAYLPNLDLNKTFYITGSSMWNNLDVRDPNYHKVSFEYKDNHNYPTRVYAYYAKNAKLNTVEMQDFYKPEKVVLVGWNTKENGEGVMYTDDTVITSDVALYPVLEMDSTDPVIQGVKDGDVTNQDVTYEVVEQNISKIIVDGKEYDKNSAPYTITAPGEHTVEIIDKAGNRANVHFTIDKTPPELNVSDKTLKVGDVFDPMMDISASDDLDGNLTDQIQIVENAVDTTKAGQYQILYQVLDKAGNTTQKIVTVTVYPKMEALNHVPVIEASDFEYRIGEKFDPFKNVRAIDEEDGDLTKAISAISKVNISQPGTYELTYQVTDSQGATAFKTIHVTVKEKDSKTVKTQNVSRTEDTTTKKDNRTNTSARTDVGLFVSLASASVLGMAVLKRLRKNKSRTS